ncbi:hypothetical protein GQ457_02G018980 [Hibiscus cannabinus]
MVEESIERRKPIEISLFIISTNSQLQDKMIHKRPYIDDPQEVASKHPRQCLKKVNGRTFTLSTKMKVGLLKTNAIIVTPIRNTKVVPLVVFRIFGGWTAMAWMWIQSQRELVSVEPEYQEDILEWSQQDMKCSLDYLDASDPQVALKSSCAGLMADNDYGKKMMGTCVIPMPDSESTSKFHFDDVGHRIDCECIDHGSIRCIGQHVTEAREKLRENLGSEIFRELGFCDMGEEVAKRWTEEEELAFDNVVLSNPFSLGKNYWDHLPEILPSRTKKDLVSYYFNVFILRKCDEQNRVDPVHVDSDEDEWQTSECAIPARDDDSVVESPTGHEAAGHYENNNEEHCHEDIEDDDNNEDGVDSSGIFDDIRRAVADENKGVIDEMSGPHVESFIDHYFCNDLQLVSCVKGNNECDYDDTQDDSCTSYEYQREQVDYHGLPESVMDANLPVADKFKSPLRS